ncbi:MAG: PHB depolymerase family esterase [Phycisphaerae bacterium]|jgi:acetyl esterase/lipase
MRCLITVLFLAFVARDVAARQTTPPATDAVDASVREPAAAPPSARLSASPSASPVSTIGLPNREMLAWWYLEVDRAWELARPNADAARTKAAHEAFDRASLAFFRFDMADAVKQLARLRRSLVGGKADLPVPAVSMQVTPRVWIAGQPAPTATLASLDRSGEVPAALVLEVADVSDHRTSFMVSAKRPEGQPGPWTLEGIDWGALRAMGGGREAASLRLTLMNGDEAIAADRLIVTDVSLAARRKEQADALATVDAKEEPLKAARAMFESRNGLLTDEPSRNRSSEFLAPYDTLTGSLALELAALRSGRSPYPLEGAWWTTVQAGTTAIPCWFDAPPAASRHAPMPLLIVLHGAGGDESMFLHGYGQGGLVKAAVAKGWVVVSPGTTAMMGSAAATKAVVKAATAMYGIDPERIYVAGHSMGGAATSMIARRSRDVIAAAVCFAGGSFDPKEACAPTLVLGAEIDPLIPASRLAANVERAAAAGRPVTYEECKDNGHTLMVGDHVSRAMAFLEGKRLAPTDSGE